jgi:hypothetical protein
VIERWCGYAAASYVRARDAASRLNAELVSLLKVYDAILTPGKTADAPKGIESTGGQVFCTL